MNDKMLKKILEMKTKQHSDREAFKTAVIRMTVTLRIIKNLMGTVPDTTALEKFLIEKVPDFLEDDDKFIPITIKILNELKLKGVK